MRFKTPRSRIPNLAAERYTRGHNRECLLMTGIECKNSKQCAPAKHHFDECVERVTNASEEDGANEDCVEECEFVPAKPQSRRRLPQPPGYPRQKLTVRWKTNHILIVLVFHLAHCAAQCAAPKLWSVLK